MSTVSAIRFDDLQGYSPQEKGSIETRMERLYICMGSINNICPAGTAFVVDGEHLNITALHKALVPPPLYGERLTFDAPIISLAHVPACLRSTSEVCCFDAIVQLSNHHLAKV